MMKRILLAAAFSGALFFTNAQLNTPQPSPTASVKQNFGLSSIELSYSRPAMKGRKIFGDLVPFDKVWRTGANNATTLTFGDDVTIGGTKIAAGKYGLLTIPGKDNWVVIISKQTDVTSPAGYKQESDVVRVNAAPEKLKSAVESFTIEFTTISANKCNMEIKWANTGVKVPIETDVESKVMAQINALMSDTSKNKPYWGAAMYYLDNNKDLNTALGWLDKAIAANPNAFWVMHQKANALARLGRKQEAIEAANKSIAVAKEAKNDDYVALNEKLLKTLK
jgi:hypothetical protein